MRVSKRTNTEYSELYISGTSSLMMSPVHKPLAIDLKNARTLSSTPESNKKCSAGLRFASKWYIRGHKFVTLYNPRKPKPAPEFHLAGKTNTCFNNPLYKPALLLKKKFNKKPHSIPNKCSMSISIRVVPQSATLKRKCSSKNLQVSPDELSS